MRQRDFDGTGTGSGSVQTDAGYFVTWIILDSTRFSFQGLCNLGAVYPRSWTTILVLTFGPVPIGQANCRTGQPPRKWSQRLHCESCDAQAKAVKVHIWFRAGVARQIFGTAPYWIGLTMLAKEGKWGWTSEEPVTYTHWATHKLTNTDRARRIMFLRDFHRTADGIKLAPKAQNGK